MSPNGEIVPFVVAGTDSALRRETTDPVLSIDMEPAERFDILITFNKI